MIEHIKKMMDEQSGADKSGILRGIAGVLERLAEESNQIAEIILQDLRNEEMSLSKCAEKLTAEAKKKAVAIEGGRGYGMGQQEAETIIREFYGLSNISTAVKIEPAAKTYNLEDLI